MTPVRKVGLKPVKGCSRDPKTSIVGDVTEYYDQGAGVAQLVSARPSELEVPGSILDDSNVYFDFLLICVALALNTRKTEH